MRQFKDRAIVLRRTNYGEADRVVAFLTHEHGKVAAMAKGVRRPKSKLGGGLEPFSESIITFGQGRGQLAIVLSTRLEKFYSNIISDYDRLQFGYEAIKLIDRSTEDDVDGSFFELLRRAFKFLDTLAIPIQFTELWFRLRLEELLGRVPDLQHDAAGEPLLASHTYFYDVHERGLVASAAGPLAAAHIKLLRLARDHSPAVLAAVQGAHELLPECLHLARNLG